MEASKYPKHSILVCVWNLFLGPKNYWVFKDTNQSSFLEGSKWLVVMKITIYKYWEIIFFRSFLDRGFRKTFLDRLGNFLPPTGTE